MSSPTNLLDPSHDIENRQYMYVVNMKAVRVVAVTECNNFSFTGILLNLILEYWIANAVFAIIPFTG